MNLIILFLLVIVAVLAIRYCMHPLVRAWEQEEAKFTTEVERLPDNVRKIR